MPFIDVKLSVPATDAQKENIKTALGQAVVTMNKVESTLMVGIADNYDLWMAGKRLEKGAYVCVVLYGDAGAKAYDAMTAKVCELLEAELGIPGTGVYVTFHPMNIWGTNGHAN